MLPDELRALTRRFEEGLGRLGMETIPGEHPVVPLMVRDTAKTNALVEHLYDYGVLATGLAYEDGPSAIRYPRGSGLGVSLSGDPTPIPLGQAETLTQGSDLCILAVGSMVKESQEAAVLLARAGL